MKKTSILYLHTGSEQHESGVATHTVGVINGFKQLGYNVIVASSGLEKIIKSLKPDDFKLLKYYSPLFFLRWKFGKFRWHLELFLSNLIHTSQLLLFTRKHCIDFIYQRYRFMSFLGVLLSFIKRKSLILEYNCSEVWVAKNWGEKKDQKLMRLANWIEKINISYAKQIIVVSQVLKDELISRGIHPKKILVNPNGVDTDIFNPKQTKEERNLIRKKLNIVNKKVFGFVGTFSYWHGIELLAETIPIIVKKHPAAHFILIGDGPLKIFLQTTLENNQIFSDHVTYTGLIPHAKVKSYLAACDVFLLPTQPNLDGSRFFGSPTKLFEYMSMAKPIIASNLEQIPEILNPSIEMPFTTFCKNSCGIIIKSASGHEFISAIQKIMNLDEKDLNLIGNNARKKAIAHYTWNQHVQRIIEHTYH